MESWDQICPGCFQSKDESTVCPHCGYNEADRRAPIVLPYRTLLNGQYLVGKVLGKPGGFGITYLGCDIHLQTKVAIKEYLPRELASRDTDRSTVVAHSREDGDLFRFGLDQFLQEARTLARFDHPNIVRVRSFFEQNGTGYLVMDYLEGVTLAEHIQSSGGRLSENQALELIMHVLDGLREVHSKGFLHRDIKPQNIYLTTSGRPILLDFGAARLAMGERSKSLSIVLTPGFAPYEQYHRRGEQGPWTDIYACGATLYYLVTGQVPADAAERVAQDELEPAHIVEPSVSPRLGSIIASAMSLKAEDRPQDVFLFFDLLAGKQEIATQPVHRNIPETLPLRQSASQTPPSFPQQTTGLNGGISSAQVVPDQPVENSAAPLGHKKLIIAAIAAVVVLGIGIALFGTSRDAKEAKPTTPPKQTIPAAADTNQPAIGSSSLQQPQSLGFDPPGSENQETQQQTAEPSKEAPSQSTSVSQPTQRQSPSSPAPEPAKESSAKETKPPAKKGGSLW